MSRVILTGVVLFAVMLGIAGCSSNIEPSNSEPIEATWIDIQADGDTVSIPLSEVNSNKIVHFLLGEGPSGDIAFMAYELAGKTYVRSNVCPPCWSMGFSLQGDTLVCDTCATTFNAKTGDGIKGACVDFPKASVPYEIRGETIIMERNDMITAYKNTLEPEWP